MMDALSWAWGPWSVGLGVIACALVMGVTRAWAWRGLPSALRLRFARDTERSVKATAAATLRTNLAATAGIGTIAAQVFAVQLGGPGAVLWCAVATLFGLAIVLGETFISLRRQTTTSVATPVHTPRPGVRALVAIAAALAALCIGGVFQAQHAAALARHVVPIRPLAVSAIVAATAGLLMWMPSLQRLWLRAVPWLFAGMLLALAAALAQDTWGIGWALERVWNDAFTARPVVIGTSVAVVVTMAVQHGTLAAIHGGALGIGWSGRLLDADAVAKTPRLVLLPLFGPLCATLLLGTACSLLVLSADAEHDPSMRVVADRSPVALERVESVGLRPSKDVGQTVMLPSDTALKPGKRYAMKLRANPRGHAFFPAQIVAEQNAVVVPKWAFVDTIDTVVLRDRRADGPHNPGWDVRIDVVQEVVSAGNVSVLKLTPRDPNVSFSRLIAQRELDAAAHVVLPDFEFIATVAEAVNTDPKVGRHLALFEQRAADAPKNPALHEFFRAGYRGPYPADDAPRPPWALVATPDFTPAMGQVVRLRLAAPERGLDLVRLSPAGAIETPAWDFLANTKLVVFRHLEDPAQDIHVPVSAEIFAGRLRFTSTVEGFKNFAAARNRLGSDFEGPLLLSPDYEFDVEVHGDTRLAKTDAGKRALVPLHPLGEPVGATGSLPYTPHPAEVLTTSMLGPFIARTASDHVSARVEDELGAWPARAFVLCTLLLVPVSIAAWAQAGAVSLRGALGRAAEFIYRGGLLAMVAVAANIEPADGWWMRDVAVGIAFSLVAIALLASLGTLSRRSADLLRK